MCIHLHIVTGSSPTLPNNSVTDEIQEYLTLKI